METLLFCLPVVKTLPELPHPLGERQLTVAKEYPLLSEALAIHQIVEILGKVLGRPLQYVPIKATQERLGHSRPAIVLYAHVLDASAAEMMGGQLGDRFPVSCG